METFQEANLKPELLRALEDLGFTKPTPIQSQVLEQFDTEIKDCIALAQTGTGKTGAFSLPILNTLNDYDQDVKALVLSPTRELALQISNDIHDFAKYQKGINNLVVYGGTSISQQIKALKDRPQIVIGTPGRTKDLINRKKLDLSNVQWVVLDEADEMLSMGFQEDLDFILSSMPEERTILLFSATLPSEIKKITKKYLTNPLEITVGKRNEGAKNVTHKYFMVHRSNKYAALKRLLDVHPDIYSIVFCRTKAETNEIAAKLSTDGYNSDTLNGDLTQSQRDNVMNKFREKQIQILVATDVAARGLDVNDLTHVINFKIPDEREAYVHRSGRTGRAGKMGVSFSIIEPSEQRKIKYIEQILGKTIEQAAVPSGEDICKIQLMNFIDRLQEVEVDEAEIESFIPEINDKLEAYSKEELVKKLVSLEFNTFLNYYKGSSDITAKASSRSDRDSRKGKKDRGSSSGYTRYFINIGSRDKIQKRILLELINKVMPVRGIDIGDIQILKSFSFIELEKGYEEQAIKAFKSSSYKGRKLSLEVAQEKKSKKSFKKKPRGKY